MTKLLNTLVYVQGGEKVVTANNSYGGQTLILGNLTVSYAGQNATVTGATTIAPNATLSFNAVASSGYTLPSEIAVTIDGATATVTTDYTWDSATGVGQILANKIVGNVVITVVGVAQATVITLENISISRFQIYYSVDGGTTLTLAVGSSVLITPETSLYIQANGVFGGFITTNGTTPSESNYQYESTATITDFSGITIIKTYTRYSPPEVE